MGLNEAPRGPVGIKKIKILKTVLQWESQRVPGKFCLPKWGSKCSVGFVEDGGLQPDVALRVVGPVALLGR